MDGHYPSPFRCFLSYGQAWLPLDTCDVCKRTELLFDCEPELAWPEQWLCLCCVGAAERRHAHELDEMEVR